MADKLEINQVRQIVVDNFKKSSAASAVITLETPLSRWDGLKLRGIFIGIENDILNKGNHLGSLSVADVENSDKVGKKVGSLADAVHGDLKPAPPAGMPAHSLAAVAASTGSGERDGTQYLTGYRDATLDIIRSLQKRARNRKAKAKKSRLHGKPRSAEKPKAGRKK